MARGGLTGADSLVGSSVRGRDGAPPLLAVEGLSVRFVGRGGVTEAVAGISYEIAPERTLGVVGESGCGKTVAALALLVFVLGINLLGDGLRDLLAPEGRA